MHPFANYMEAISFLKQNACGPCSVIYADHPFSIRMSIYNGQWPTFQSVRMYAHA